MENQKYKLSWDIYSCPNTAMCPQYHKEQSCQHVPSLTLHLGLAAFFLSSPPRREESDTEGNYDNEYHI